MSEPTHNTHQGTDGLVRWLVGGLAAGGIILGLLIAAYAIGYNRGQDHARTATPAAAPPASTTQTSTTPAAPTPTLGPLTVTAALVARGRSLYTSDGCSACHSLNGTPGVGPSFKGVAGSHVTLTNGQTITATDAYLEQSISSPDAQIVKGYHAGVMPAAIASYNLPNTPNDIRALVAFITTQK